MKKYYVCLLLVGILLMSACSSDADSQTMSIAGIESLNIDHGSTSLIVESADIDSFEASWLNINGPGIIVDEEGDQINIRLKSDLRNIINIGKMPELSVRLPNTYEGKVTIDGSSGNANVKNLQSQKLSIIGKSGNVTLDYPNINHDIHVSVKSGNVVVNLEDKESNANWLLESGSGKRSVNIPLDDSKQSKRKTEGKTGDGSFKVEIKTTSGNITIK
ncbi:DUF4097 family beta strand repeat-containing protein [Paenibacillus aquistagni]|uniref:Putative adhesin n=1 Tax=Paenibacillus aquistagni TaxID=1852522 RepID=A0A1X7KL39_9BACL|nr:DUF4097 family beta strand repeat-containing protein [Paenibacillus aquistagni]SMG41747.1 Putative adhesin [Paenibacillus aquistagni]